MLTVRRFEPDFSNLPRHWYAGDPVLTHGVNALNLIFPDGERFFVRSVRRYERCVTDPALKADVRAFVAQESHHGHAHAQQIAVLEAQGYEVQSWLARYRLWAFDRLERWVPPRLRLAGTVAMEHLTASFAEFALVEPYLDAADPNMAALLRWHAAEEIEHRAVAFEVHRAAGGGYVERFLGMVLALSVLALFWRDAHVHLLRQEPDLTREQVEASRRRLKAQGRSKGALLWRAVGPYLRPGFHPAKAHDDGPAMAYLASVGRLSG